MQLNIFQWVTDQRRPSYPGLLSSYPAAVLTVEQAYGFLSFARACILVLVRTKDKGFHRVSSIHRMGLCSANSRKLHTFCSAPGACRTQRAVYPLQVLHNKQQESWRRRWNPE